MQIRVLKRFQLPHTLDICKKFEVKKIHYY